MLGKGLESLIPQGGNIPKNHGSSPADSTNASGAVPKISGEEPVFKKAFSESPGPAKPRSDQEYIFQIETEKIKPNPLQPRRDFNEDALQDLANSIREFGILQPLIVRKIEHEVPSGTAVEYELIAGERRLMAAKLLGLPRVPVIIKKFDVQKDRLEVAIIENLQRENLNPLETARAFARLQDEFRLTQREIATRLGKSRETVANTMRLLDLPTYIQDAIAKGEISETHGRLLLAVTDKSAQEKIFRDLADKHLSTRELKHRVFGATKSVEERRPEIALSPELKALEEKLSAGLGTPVKIEGQEAGGKITITFYSGEELKGIVERLAGEEESTDLSP